MDMTYEEFLKLAKTSEQYDERSLPVTSYYDTSKTPKIPMLIVSVETGGYGGGNCWGDKASYFSNNDPLPDLNIDFLLECFVPNITYLEYKKLMSKLNIQSGNWTNCEYYGNSTNYDYHYILISDLYEALKNL